MNISLRSLLSSNKLEIEYNGLLKDSSFFFTSYNQGICTYDEMKHDIAGNT